MSFTTAAMTGVSTRANLLEVHRCIHKFREMGIEAGDAAPSLPSSLNPIQSAYRNPNFAPRNPRS
jgi:hypothetical protein